MNIPNDNSIEITPSDKLNNIASELDVNGPKAQEAITQLPVDFKISTIHDICILKTYLACKYAMNGLIRMYRGHASDTYKLESTIVREVKAQKRTSRKIANAEKKAIGLFNQNIYNNLWTKNKPQNSSLELYKLSIARHLGMPCRLIDVTACLETAVFFAVSDPRHYHENGEIIIFILDKNKFKTPTSISFKDEVY